MFHQPLCRTQYGNCKAWRFAIIKHIFNDVTPDWKRSAGQPGWTSPCVCFVRPQLINSKGFSPRLDKPIKFMSPVFFFFRRERRWIWCVLLLGTAILSCHHLALSPQESKLSPVPPEPYGSHHPAPLFPVLISHYRDLTNPLFAMFCVIFSSARLSRCCDCTIQTVGLLKAERETATPLRARERKKALGTSSEE